MTKTQYPKITYNHVHTYSVYDPRPGDVSLCGLIKNTPSRDWPDPAKIKRCPYCAIATGRAWVKRPGRLSFVKRWLNETFGIL